MNQFEPKKKATSKPVALLISIFFPPEIGGGSTGAWNRAMVLYKMGYSVFVICGFPAYPSGKVSDSKYKGKLFCVESLEPFTVIRLRLLPIEYSGVLNRLVIFLNFVFLTVFFMPKILRITGKIDIVYSRAPVIFSSISGFVYSRFEKSFFIYEAPDLLPEELAGFKTHLLFMIMRLGKVVAKLSYMLPDVVITTSELSASHVSREYRPKAPVHGIPVGVDPSKFPRLSKYKSRAELIDNKILPYDLQNKFIILYSGIISAAQRVEYLAYAAERLKGEKEIAILIIGEGPDKQQLEQLKLERNLDNFYILPSQPRNLMPSIIAAVDICTILLSGELIFNVALPTKFYEYLASGKAVIGVCQGELANMINSSKIGLTVKAGDIDGLASIIKELKNSPTLMQTMENNSYSTLRRFSLDNIASKFQDILKEQID